jgi:pyruvate-ferredoxin/flavodoxin oxidoreductase
MVGGDGACLGCGEKTVVHLFVATAEALMQPRVARQIEKIDDLIARLDQHTRLKLAATIDLSDDARVANALDHLHNADVTLASFSEQLDSRHAGKTIDPEWLRWVSQLIAKLKHLRWQYTDGAGRRGRSSMGIVNSTGCTSVWASTYPFNPYPFPWTNHLFQDSPSMAMGIFEGHMARMAEGFAAVRMAEIELDGGYRKEKQGEFFTYFNWKQFTDEEFHLCPPVVSIGGDGAMYDIGFQNLSRMMMSGKPIKVLVLDTQVYSNTGGQACTSGFTGQVSDMAQYGKAFHGKEEIRKEIALIGMAHRTTFIAQGTTANTSHLIESFVEGLNARRPALFNIYSPCMPEHGIADDLAEFQSKLAVEPGRQSVARCRLADLHLEVSGRDRRPRRNGSPDDLRRLRHDRRPVPQAVPHGSPRRLEREHGSPRRVPGIRSRRQGREVPLHLGGEQEEQADSRDPGRAAGSLLRRPPALLAIVEVAGRRPARRRHNGDRRTGPQRIRAVDRGAVAGDGGQRHPAR